MWGINSTWNKLVKTTLKERFKIPWYRILLYSVKQFAFITMPDTQEVNQQTK